MPSVEVLEGTTDRARLAAAVAALQVSDPVAAAEASGVEAGVAVGADKPGMSRRRNNWSTKMRSASANRSLTVLTCIFVGWASASGIPALAQTSAAKATNTAPKPSAQTYASPQEAADALVSAADKFDVDALTRIFGPDSKDIIFSGETAQDKKHAADFVAQAREKESFSVDPKTSTRAFLLVGDEDWPFPVPLVKRNGKWSFDAKAGRQELLYRRVGANELDAIQLCHGYVEAQHAYALQKREGYEVNQYAQRIISTPGKQDGLAWQNPDGTWSGPVGEKIARAIDQGYKLGSEPYHGYFFKILKGQGPAAPLGQMNFVVKGLMIGGFALVAAPAEYGKTGVRSFIVSHDGVVYEKDLGPATLDQFKKMQLFNPDKSWAPVQEQGARIEWQKFNAIH